MLNKPHAKEFDTRQSSATARLYQTSDDFHEFLEALRRRYENKIVELANTDPNSHGRLANLQGRVTELAEIISIASTAKEIFERK